jgi:ADP-dependent NAD(P)H-hydrate dehydratase / NAD(P)H-hydrate epimerase
MKVVTIQEMKAAESAADSGGFSYARMMENAGSAVAQDIARLLTVQGRSVVVLVGPGNNGGDGLVAARYLHDAQAHVTVYLWAARPDTDPNYHLVQERSISVIIAGADPDMKRLEGLAQQADVIIDALLGTGAARPIEGTMKAMLETVHSVIVARPEPPIVVAVDLPSGLNADTGSIDPAALPADLTVTFAFPKRGHYLFPGAGYVGELVVADIGISEQTAASVALELAEVDGVAKLLPRRPRDAHKGTFGKLLVVAGCANYTGAAYLAATAAYRSGAGLVTLAIARSLHPILAVKTSEVTFLPLPEAEPGYLGPDGLPVLLDALPGYDAVLIGCGLGAHPKTRDLVVGLAQELKNSLNLRVVIDADGLNALAGRPEWWTMLPEQCVLTPHPGEMSRLSGTDMDSIAADRIGVARASAAAWKQIVVLKGAYTIVAAPAGQASINPFANPALATAGTGDVLAGTIAGLLTQACKPYDAAVSGAFVHGLAGESVAQSMGEAGLIAGDLLPALPQAMRALRHPQADDSEDQ